MAERAVAAQEYFQLEEKIHPGTLWNYYQENNIKWRVAEYHWSSRYSMDELHAQQKLWGLDIIKYMRQGREIWFVDETSTHLWQKQNRIWRGPGSGFHLTLAKKRGRSHTVIGAISFKEANFRYIVAQTTNTLSVLEFLKTQFVDAGIDTEGHVFVLDRHSAHNSKKVQAYIKDDMKAMAHMLHPASCCLNPIGK